MDKIASNVENLKNQNTFSNWYEDNQWMGSLSSIKLGDMYKVKLTQADTIVYEGVPVDLSNAIYHIDIYQGWNYIGYLGQRSLDINTALSSISFDSGDLIKSQNSFSVFASESLGWLGTLNALNEGEGYKLKSASNHTLIYPDISLYGSNRLYNNHNQSADDYWNVNSNKYEHSMSIIARIDDINYFDPNQENVLGGFKGEECVGNITVTKIDDVNSLYFLTVYGNAEDILSFKYYDSLKDKIYLSDNSIEFESNQLVGSIDDPYLIEFDAQDNDNYPNINVFPNPFEDVFEIEYSIDKTSEVDIVLYDVMGRAVKTIYTGILENGIHMLNFDASELSKGCYFIEINSSDVSYRKSIIKS